MQHTLPKGFQRIRYYGVQATKTFATLKGLIQEALAKVKGIIKGAIKIIAPMTYRQRYRQSTGGTPCAVRTATTRWGYGASGTHNMA